jgi:hypothetical protein
VWTSIDQAAVPASIIAFRATRVPTSRVGLTCTGRARAPAQTMGMRATFAPISNAHMDSTGQARVKAKITGMSATPATMQSATTINTEAVNALAPLTVGNVKVLLSSNGSDNGVRQMMQQQPRLLHRH